VVGLEEAYGQRHVDDPDGDVDEEDRMPAGGLGERTTGDDADRASRRGHEAEDTDHPGLLAWPGEHRHDHAQGHGAGHRAADALDEPPGYQQLLAERATTAPAFGGSQEYGWVINPDGTYRPA
jgi:hypothetical protein